MVVQLGGVVQKAWMTCPKFARDSSRIWSGITLYTWLCAFHHWIYVKETEVSWNLYCSLSSEEWLSSMVLQLWCTLKRLYIQNVYARVAVVPKTNTCFLTSLFLNSCFYLKMSLGCIWNSPNDKQESEPPAFLNVIISLWCLLNMGIYPTRECREDLFLIRGLGKK